MGFIGRLIGLAISLLLLAAIGSAIAAAYFKGRLASRGEPGDDDVEVVAIFDSLEFASTAPALRRMAVLTWYGGGTLDLRGATLDPDGATLTLRAALGGIRLVVPESWPVELALTGAAGGIADGRDQGLVDAAAPLLRIEGFAVLGGAAIVSAAPDLDAAVTTA